MMSSGSTSSSEDYDDTDALSTSNARTPPSRDTAFAHEFDDLQDSDDEDFTSSNPAASSTGLTDNKARAALHRRSMQPGESLAARGNSKLKAFFGDENPGVSQAITPPIATNVTPWYLKPRGEESLLFENGQVKGGTLSALIARLTSHEQAGTMSSCACCCTTS